MQLPAWMQRLFLLQHQGQDVNNILGQRGPPPELWSPEASARRYPNPPSIVQRPDALPARPQPPMAAPPIPFPTINRAVAASTQNPATAMATRASGPLSDQPPAQGIGLVDKWVRDITGIALGHQPRGLDGQMGPQGLGNMIAVGAMFLPELRGLLPARAVEPAAAALRAAELTANPEARLFAAGAPEWSVLSSPARTGRPAPAVGNLALDIPTFMRQPYRAERRGLGTSMNVPTFMRRREDATGIYKSIVDQGGVTLNPLTRKPSQATGFAVADPAFTHTIPANVENPAEAIQRWMQSPQVRDRLKQPHAHIGGWRDPQTGQIEVNVTDVIADEGVARRIGGQRQQKAIGRLEQGAYQGDVNLPQSWAEEQAQRAGSPSMALTRRPNMALAPVEQRSTALVPYQPRSTALVRQPGTGSSVLAEGLSRDAAVGQMKTFNAAGIRAQMQRRADGTFAIVRKGAPQAGTAVMKAKPKPPAPAIGPRGEAEDLSGFQSRLRTVVDTDPNMPEQATIRDWIKRLNGNPNVPKAELKAVMDAYGAQYDDHLATAAKVVTHDELLDIIDEFSPVRHLEREVLEGSGGREMTEEVINQEVEHLAEQEAEYYRNDRFPEELRARDERLNELKTSLQDFYGPEGGEREFQALMEEYDPLQQADFEGMDERTLSAYADETDNTNLEQAIERLNRLRGDPAQLPLPGVRGPDPNGEQLRGLVQRLQRAEGQQAEAARALLDADPDRMDMDFLRQQAVEGLEQTGDFTPEGEGVGNTEYSTYQRVDQSAPYREILVINPDLKGKISGGHFSDSGVENIQTHARGEIHDNTYLMIEAQSDVGQKANRPGAGYSRSIADNPFVPTERWAQLSTGASLRQAADEGLDRFAWVTPEDRVRRASLHPESAHITYGIAVPKAVERIFRWLDEPMKITMVKLKGGTFPSVKLTVRMRKKILKAGVPALSTIPFLPGLLEERPRR